MKDLKQQLLFDFVDDVLIVARSFYVHLLDFYSGDMSSVFSHLFSMISFPSQDSEVISKCILQRVVFS